MSLIKSILSLIKPVLNNVVYGDKKCHTQLIDVFDDKNYIYYIDEFMSQLIKEDEVFSIVSRNKRIMLSMRARIRLEQKINN